MLFVSGDVDNGRELLHVSVAFVVPGALDNRRSHLHVSVILFVPNTLDNRRSLLLYHCLSSLLVGGRERSYDYGWATVLRDRRASGLAHDGIPLKVEGCPVIGTIRRADSGTMTG